MLALLAVITINLSEMFHIPRAFHLMQPKHLQSVTRMISHALGPGPPGLKRYPEGLIQINPEVAEALVRRKPVIALESTVIAHGMPYPENLRVAKDVERIVRENGATPATVAVIAGKIHACLKKTWKNLLVVKMLSRLPEEICLM